MIKVRNKILFIPEDEVRLASGDNNSVVREFHIDRVQPDGVDLANLLFKLDILYVDTNSKDTAMLDKVITDDEIVLVWTATSAVTAHAGAFFFNIRAFDSDGYIHWSSYQGVFYLENTIGEGADKTQLAELEALESKIDKKTTALDAAESTRVTAENARAAAETARENAFREASNKFAETQASADAAEKVAKSWAVGPNGSTEASGTDMNNSKYYSDKSASSAEAAKQSETNAKKYNDNVVAQADAINQAKSAANQAAENAQSVANTIQAKLDSGELKGEKGEKGSDGTNGVITEIDGMFTMKVDTDGNLYCYYNDSGTGQAPSFEYNSDTGELDYIVQEG